MEEHKPPSLQNDSLISFSLFHSGIIWKLHLRWEQQHSIFFATFGRLSCRFSKTDVVRIFFHFKTHVRLICFREQIPDLSIATLYPVEDNYVNESSGLRSPKTLAALATDAVCRSLPYVNGGLPPGLPQDVVDDIIYSLIKHSAVNATTLRTLCNCEFSILSLANCRGVTDSWLKALANKRCIS